MPYGWTFQGDELVGVGARVWWGGYLKVCLGGCQGGAGDS